GGLARAGGACDQDDAVGLADHTAELSEHVRFQADAVEVQADVAAVKHADDAALAEHGRQDADAHIDGIAADVELDAAVLGESALGYVEVGHDLDARGDGHGEMTRRRDHFIEHAVAT